MLTGIFRIHSQTILLQQKQPRIQYGLTRFTGIVEKVNGNKHTVKLFSLVDPNNKIYTNSIKIVVISDELIPIFTKLTGVVDLCPIQSQPIPGWKYYNRQYFYNRVIGYGELKSKEVYGTDKVSGFKSTLLGLILNKFSQPKSGIIIASILGINSYLDQELVKKFQIIGLGHLLSISGLHFSLAACGGYFLGRWLLGWLLISQKKNLLNYGIFTSLITLYLYMFFTVTNWSIIRSILMFNIPVLCILLGRRSIEIAPISISLVIMLLIWPSALLDLGFQLSFVAVFSLILCKGNIFKYTTCITLTTSVYLLHSLRTITMQPYIATMLSAPIFSFIIMPLIFINIIFGFHGPFAILLDKGLDLFLYTTSIIAEFQVAPFGFYVNETGLLLWTIGLLSWVLIQCRAVLILLCLSAFCFKIKDVPRVFIGYSGNELIFYESGRVLSDNPESFHVKLFSDFVSARSILPVPDKIKITNNMYSWRGIDLRLSGTKRFIEATHKGKLVLTRWNMITQSSSAIIEISNKFKVILN